ncbi:MAG: DEAD/DEAH box helicase, partial [Saprospiraceae bacterium]|nr:DEAD/DEAH box helicase [Saprospiraceae bacterium]
DWFDIYGQVEIGEFTIPFLALVKNIRQGDRFYRLPDNSYFLIPEEWMTRYKALAQFLKRDGKQLRLNKAQFTLLKEVGLGDVPTLEEEPENIDFTPSSLLKASLRPYQLEGVKWMVQLYQNDLGACLADDMGLGKTIQTIATLLHAKERKQPAAQSTAAPQLNIFQANDADFLNPLHALIVLPASLVFNWEREIQKFAPSLSVYKHTGTKRYKDMRLISRFDVILTTYQTALRDVDLLEELEYEYIILDESQQIKNKDSKVFKAINKLQARHKVSLSGTPIENSLSDLWAQMQFINPDLLGNFTFFKREFIGPIERKQDDAKKDQLRKLVQPYLLRRTKEEVARDLPPLSTKIFYTEMTPEQKRMYEREKSATRNQLLDNFESDNPKFKIMVLQSLTKLRQIVNHPKLVNEEYKRDSGKFNDILEHWDVIRKGGHKVLFFSSFVKHLNLFKEAFEKQNLPYSWLSGETSANKRVEAIEYFDKNPEVQSFLISIKSGGTGLNLTAADYVFILDPWWNPTIEQQAIARAHRIGQEKNVFAFKFITKGTIEEKILKLQERKTKLAEDIIEDVGKAQFSRNDLEFLLE